MLLITLVPGNRPDIRLKKMVLYLVNPAVEMPLELYVPHQLEEALSIQYERIKDGRVRDTFVKRLEERLEALLSDSIDWDIKAPTAAQLSYAMLVSQQVGVPLPSEAKRFRFHTAMFLETYANHAKSPGITEHQSLENKEN
jgi:hypothetical protein